LAAQSTSDASIGPADIGGFEEGEFETVPAGVTGPR
jgi:hypothetical protein